MTTPTNPLVHFSWKASLGNPSCDKVETLNDTDSKWMFDFQNSFCIESEEETPCYLDISTYTGRILSVEIISNARNVEFYSQEVKQCLGGGELPPEWEYCETIKGSPFDFIDKIQFLKSSLIIPPCRFQSSTHENHAVRLKLLSIKPKKLVAYIFSVSVVVKSANTIGESRPMSHGNCGDSSTMNTDKQVSQSLDAAALQGILSSAMFAVDAKLTAACSGIESRLTDRMKNIEGTVKELKATVDSLQQIYDQTSDAKSNENGRKEYVESALPITEWDSSDVYCWLEKNGYGKYIPALQLVGVLDDGPSLLSLTNDDLQSEELGIDEKDVHSMGVALYNLRTTT